MTHKHTRFRAWEMIVGRPIEYAASLIGESVSFSKMLEEIEAEDETSIASVEVIMALNRKWTGGEIFEAKDVAKYCTLQNDAPDVALLRDYFDPRAKGDISSVKIGKALKVLKDAPFPVAGEGTIKLVGGGDDLHAKIRAYKIERTYPNQ